MVTFTDALQYLLYTKDNIDNIEWRIEDDEKKFPFKCTDTKVFIGYINNQYRVSFCRMPDSYHYALADRSFVPVVSNPHDFVKTLTSKENKMVEEIYNILLAKNI